MSLLQEGTRQILNFTLNKYLKGNQFSFSLFSDNNRKKKPTIRSTQRHEKIRANERDRDRKGAKTRN